LTFGFCRKVGEEKQRDKTYDGNTFAALGDFRFDLYDGNLMEMGMQWDGLEIWHYIRHRIKNRIEQVQLSAWKRN
jgi:hypothetical protein